MNPAEAAAAKQTVDYFSQYGPWALLTVVLLAAIGYAGWKVYLRMANALDNMHGQTVLMAKEHSDKIETLVQQHTDEIKSRDERMITVVENNTKGFSAIVERLGGVENRLDRVEDSVKDFSRARS